MNISLIAALSSNNRVIGLNGNIPWKLKGDLSRFKRLTMGHPIIMGRKTYESIGNPLPGRENIVLSRQEDYQPEGVTVFNHVAQLLSHFNDSEEELFIIGGEKIYEAFLPVATTLHLTFVEGDYEGDAFFPEFNADDFVGVHREFCQGEPKHRYDVLKRVVTKKPSD